MDAPATAAPETPKPTGVAALRLRLEPSQLAALAASPLLAPTPNNMPRRIQDRFFDTADYALARNGITLWQRKSGRTLRLMLFHNGETLEAAASATVPGPAAFGPDWQATFSAVLKEAPLHEIARASLKQTTRELGETMLIFETGHLIATGQKTPISEIELSGPALAVPGSAAALGAFAPRLQPEPPGPRAVRLAGGPPPCLHKTAASLAGDLSLDEAVETVLSTCLDQFLANWPVFYEGNEVAAVHQMRVAMRRLRSALGLFYRALPAPEFLALRDEAKRIAAALGEARNWDVFIAMLGAGPAAAFPHEAGFAALEAQCTAYRQAGYAQARALLEDPATTRFLLMAESFIARRGWRGGLPAETLPRLAEPARAFGEQSLERLHRKLRKRGKHLASLTPERRHRVRIDLKKLRYAAEFFSALLEPRQRVRQFHHAASALQDELGKLNDMATAEDMARRLHGDSPEAIRALGIVLGWAAHAARGEPRAIASAWKDFRKVKPLA